ncbi:MAG: hypothetical protein OXF85_00700 [Candidatus Saccharibacteria bacterium]|nr:hypothetical protein [Candidatus Saccharibacteria bacterium]MCY4088571.1 hypothetical protein [Candidatus Saccharibacteria bacterium]
MKKNQKCLTSDQSFWSSKTTLARGLMGMMAVCLISILTAATPIAAAGGPSSDYESAYDDGRIRAPWERQLIVVHVNDGQPGSWQLLENLLLNDEPRRFFSGEIPFVVDRVISVQPNGVESFHPILQAGGGAEGSVDNLYSTALREAGYACLNTTSPKPQRTTCHVVLISSIVDAGFPVCQWAPQCHWDIMESAVWMAATMSSSQDLIDWRFHTIAVVDTNQTKFRRDYTQPKFVQDHIQFLTAICSKCHDVTSTAQLSDTFEAVVNRNW